MAIRKGCLPYVQYLTKAPEEGVFLGMLTSNKAFKSLAEKTAKAIREQMAAAGQTGMTITAENVVSDAVKSSIGLTEKQYPATAKNKRWLHPATILIWLGNLAASLTDEAWRADAESATMIGAFIRYQCVPGQALRYWHALEKALKIRPVYPFSREVYVPRPPASKVMRGYQLTELAVSIPVGVKFYDIAPDRPRQLGPEQERTITLNLLDPRVVEKFGEVWIAVSADGRYVGLASSQKPTVNIMDLLHATGSLSAANTISDYPLAINEPHSVPNRKLPDAFAQQLAAAKAAASATSLTKPPVAIK